MKSVFRFLSIGLIFVPPVVMAEIPQVMTPYPITETVAVAERILQTAQSELSNEADKDALEASEKKRKMRDPKADKAEVIENKGNPDGSEFPPYGDAKLRQALSKENPSIPEVEAVIKSTFIYNSKTLNSKNDQPVDTRSEEDVAAETQDGTLEKMQIQTFITFENARALAVRSLDLMEKSHEDRDDMETETHNRTTTGSIQKGMASSIIFRTHMMLNEIATIRNSYIEINAINTIQGVEAPQKEGMLEGILNNFTGG